MSPFAKYALCVLLGILVGVGITAAMVIPKTDAMLAQDQKTIEAQKQTITEDETALKASTQAMQKTGLVLSERNRIVTLLYDPKANQSLALEGKLVQIYPNNRAVPYQGLPRWIIPGRVRPMIAGNSADATYLYYDPGTETYDGPFLPDVPQQRQ